jgi:hypothetical protein
MDEQTAFEARAVIAPQRARLSRLAPLLPVIALAGIVWAGVSGGRPEEAAVVVPDASSAAALSPAAPAMSSAPVAVHPEYPAEVVGLEVLHLGDVQLARLTRDDVIAIAGWYVPLAIVDCPRLTPAVGEAFPSIRPGFDPWAYCERSGVLYAARPERDAGALRMGGRDEEAGDGPRTVDASLTIGVKLPLELERVGADPMPVVVLGHFVESSSACMLLGACPSELVVDYLAWSAGAAQ